MIQEISQKIEIINEAPQQENSSTPLWCCGSHGCSTYKILYTNLSHMSWVHLTTIKNIFLHGAMELNSELKNILNWGNVTVG
jgi:hypothetical protein